jgi:hypothetical protein
MNNFDNMLGKAIQKTSGWLDGEGKATTEEAIVMAKLLLKDILFVNFFSPVIFPTEEGGLQMEFPDNLNDFTVCIRDNGATLWWAFDEIGHYIEDVLWQEDVKNGKFIEVLEMVKEIKTT